MQTSRALAASLNAVLGDSTPRMVSSFQSRLGRTPWIQPYTEDILKQLPAQGIKRLAVVSPSFTADCLETLEELGERGKHTFIEAGGEAFELVSAVNFSPIFASTAANWVKSSTQAEKTFLHPNR
jgi:ferrochelatase